MASLAGPMARGHRPSDVVRLPVALAEAPPPNPSQPRIRASFCKVSMKKNHHHGPNPQATPFQLVMTLALTLAGTAAVAQSEDIVPGRVVLHAKAGLAERDLAKIVGPQGGRLRALGAGLYVLDLPPTASPTAVRQQLARHPALKFAEFDRRFRMAGAVNDPLAGSAWHLGRINAATAWDRSTGSGVTIAILDTGVDASHPDLATQVVSGWNVVDNNSDSADFQGHGTAVAGAAAAALNNATGVASVAGGARIMPIRIADSAGYATGSGIASALIWAADRGARVANISFTGVVGNPTVQAAAQYLKSRGGLVVVSAGNSGSNLGLAVDPNFIPVSATESDDSLASWSSYGPYVAVSAPGNLIWTTQKGGTYGQWWGTSFASPITAGVVALMMGARPDLSGSQIESLLYQSALDLGAAGRDAQFGHGRVDATAAVNAALAASAADTTAPTATLLSPGAGATVQGRVPVEAAASDNQSVSRVELRVNGSTVATDIGTPYQFSWDTSTLANGSHTLQVVAFDAAGNAGASARVSVTVANATVADTTAPVVTLSSPVNGSRVSTSSVTVSFTASDNLGSTGLRNTLFINGKVVATSTGASLTYRWNTRKLSAGSYTLRATSADAAGNLGAASATVTR
jgi:thermitase